MRQRRCRCDVRVSGARLDGRDRVFDQRSGFISERVSISQRDVRMVQLAKKRCLRGNPDLDRKRRNFDGGGRPAGDRRRLWELFES